MLIFVVLRHECLAGIGPWLMIQASNDKIAELSAALSDLDPELLPEVNLEDHVVEGKLYAFMHRYVYDHSTCSCSEMYCDVL